MEIRDKILKGEKIEKEDFLRFLMEIEKPQDCLFLERNIKSYEEHLEEFKKIKIGILRSSTVEPIIPFFKISLLKRKIYPKIFLGGYNSITQNLLNPEDWLNELDIIVIWFRFEDLLRDLYYKFFSLKEEEKDKLIEEFFLKFNNWLELSKRNFKGKVIVTNLDYPPVFPSHIYDSNAEKGLIYKINELNYKILESCKKFEGVYLFDLLKVQISIGIENYFDKRLSYLAKFPFSQKSQLKISEEFSRLVSYFYRTPKKVLVLDLDNTLWGGIIGEDGLSGIKLNSDYPGSVFLDFQSKVLELYNQGIILTISSKNNFEDAINVFRNHPNIILKEENFAVMKIDWNEKEKHLEEISKILNLGLDSFVFIDDNPFECERIRKALPEVFVIRVPENLWELPEIFEKYEVFDLLTLTEEDKIRGKMYREEVKRESLRISSFSIEDFYYSLKMEITFGKAGIKTYKRLAQLTQRTNQFNLTTKRYQEENLINFSSSKDYRIWWASLKDSFGDYGVISLAIIKVLNKLWEIDTFLLSCRAIQKTVETAFLSFILKEAKKEEIKKITGKIIYTNKNMPARDFYKRHNFNLISKDEKGEEWACNVAVNEILMPPWFSIKEEY